MPLLVSTIPWHCLRRPPLLAFFCCYYYEPVINSWCTFFFHDAWLLQTVLPRFPWGRSSPDTQSSFFTPHIKYLECDTAHRNACQVLQKQIQVEQLEKFRLFKILGLKSTQLFFCTPGIKYKFISWLVRISWPMSLLLPQSPHLHPSFHYRTSFSSWLTLSMVTLSLSLCMCCFSAQKTLHLHALKSLLPPSHITFEFK